MLWIDSVASVLVCPQDEVWIGQAVAESGVQLPFQANIRRRHLKLRRVDGRYWMDQPTPTDDNNLAEDPPHQERPTSLLVSGQQITLSEGLGIRLRIPSPLTSTAVLDYWGPLRSVPRTDFAILMAQACLLGNSNQHHIVIPELDQATLFFQGPHLALRYEAPATINGKMAGVISEINDGDRIESATFAMSLEVLR